MNFIDFHNHRKVLPNGILGIRNVLPLEYAKAQISDSDMVSVGIHPYNAGDKNVDEQLNVLKEIALCKNIVAIGEIGLDKSISVDFETQKSIFSTQIILSGKIKKPAIIHCVRAFDEIIKIYKDKKINVPLIFHSFVGKPETVAQIKKINSFVSFGTRIVKNRSWDAAITKAYELQNFFLETDDNENVSIDEIYSVVAKNLNINIEILKQNIYERFCKIINYI